MGGVLQRLAQRALPGTGGVRPRLAGRYEAAAEPVGQVAETIGERFGTQGDAAPPSIANPSRPPTATPRPLPQAGLAPDRQPFAQRPLEAPHVAALPPAAPGERSIGAAPPLLFQAAPIQPVAPVFPPSLATAPARATAPERAFARPGPAADKLTPAPPAAFPTAPPAPFGLLLPELRTAIDAVIATSPHAAPFASEAMARETPPDLHISIGRIEVRADRPEPRQPPRPPARPRAKTMSLEDYLAKGRGR